MNLNYLRNYRFCVLLLKGYIGPFTWDVKRLVASINIIAFSKAYSDEKIAKIISVLIRSYLSQIQEYCNSSERYHMGLTSENTRGPVNNLLKESRLGSKEAHLDTMTVVDNFERKFIRSKTVTDVDDQLRHQIILAFQDYVRTIPAHKKESSWPYKVENYLSKLYFKFYCFSILSGERYRSTCITWYWISR